MTCAGVRADLAGDLGDDRIAEVPAVGQRAVGLEHDPVLLAARQQPAAEAERAEVDLVHGRRSAAAAITFASSSAS